MSEIQIDGETLTIRDIIEVARANAKVVIAESAGQKVRRSRQVLENLIKEGNVIYGVNTGFGELSNVKISPVEIEELQTNLIRSHSVGVGKPLSKETVRAVMLLRINTLAKGYSGIRLQTLETLVEMLNKGVVPVIPEKGSVGASGDLAPLSHLMLVLIGEGRAEYEGRVLDGREAMRRAGIPIVQLKFKEGLALNNGTQVMTAIAALLISDAWTLVEAAETAAALSFETLLGITDALDERIHRIRPHPGQIRCAANLNRLIAGSQLVSSGRDAMTSRNRPHDPYSLRCVPQVLGTIRDALKYVQQTIQTEINSATDNPLVFAEDKQCMSGGNFHGQPISLALDMIGIVLAMLGNFSERRISRLVDGKLSNGLPPFLIPPESKPGLNSGLMTVQYTAAALASENKILAHPACVDSIPTSANFEDFVSMGLAAALKARSILENAQHIIAIELLCAAQAADFRRSEKLGKGTRRVYETIRKMVPTLRRDKVLNEEIEKIADLVRNGSFP